MAIANYMAARANTQGATPAEFAMSQMCMAEGEDLYSIMGSKNLQCWKAAADRSLLRCSCLTVSLTLHSLDDEVTEL